MLARRQAELRIVGHVAQIVLQPRKRLLLHVWQRPLDLELSVLSFVLPLAKRKTQTQSSIELFKQPGP